MASAIAASYRGLQKLTVRDLGRDVVGNVSLANTVEDVRSDGAHEVPVDRAKGTTGEGPLVCRVVG